MAIPAMAKAPIPTTSLAAAPVYEATAGVLELASGVLEALLVGVTVYVL